MDGVSTSGIEVKDATEREWKDAVAKSRISEAFHMHFDPTETAEKQAMQTNFVPEKKSLAFSNESGDKTLVLSVVDAQAAFDRSEKGDRDNVSYNGISTEELGKSLEFDQHVL